MPAVYLHKSLQIILSKKNMLKKFAGNKIFIKFAYSIREAHQGLVGWVFFISVLSAILVD